jgi:hypothetical protein
MPGNILTRWAKPRPNEQKQHKRSLYVDENARQFKIQYCTEHTGINDVGTWGESSYTLPGEVCGISRKGKHCYTLKVVLNLQNPAVAVVA